MIGLHSNSGRSGDLLAGDDQATRLRALMDRLAKHAPHANGPASGGVSDQAASSTDAAPVRAAPIIAVASGKGGVGKTNVSVNLAIALAQRGLRVTLLDADLGVANADLLCGINPAARVEQALAKRDCGLEDFAVDAPGGFRLVPGTVGISRAADLGLADRQRLVQGLIRLGQTNDVLIVDTGAGVGSMVTTFVAAADLALVVVTPEPTSIADAYALIKCVRTMSPTVVSSKNIRPAAIEATNIRLVINQAASEQEAGDVLTRISGVCERFLRCRIGLAGVIAQDPRLIEAVKSRYPVLLRTPRSAASRDLTALGARVAETLGLACSAEDLQRLESIPERARPGVLKRLLAFTLGQ